MSTTIGKVHSEGIFDDNTVEVYDGVNFVVLFVQNGLDRDGKGTKILLSESKLDEFIEFLQLAGQAKGWIRND